VTTAARNVRRMSGHDQGQAYGTCLQRWERKPLLTLVLYAYVAERSASVSPSTLAEDAQLWIKISAGMAAFTGALLAMNMVAIMG
jgi:hypothetical protein